MMESGIVITRDAPALKDFFTWRIFVKAPPAQIAANTEQRIAGRLELNLHLSESGRAASDHSSTTHNPVNTASRGKAKKFSHPEGDCGAKCWSGRHTSP